MLKEIKNKSIKPERSKQVENDSQWILVNLKNLTAIDGKVLPKGDNYVSKEEYEKIKSFL